MRPPRLDRDRDIGAQVGELALARDQPRARRRGMALEPAGQIARALERDPERPERRRQADAAVGDVEDEIGQLERLAARRRQQFVDLAPAHPVVHQPPAQPDAAREDPIDLDRSVPFDPHLDLGEPRGEVRPLGIADDEVADLLGAQPDPVEPVGRLHAAPLELALEEVGRDRPAGDPHAGERDEQDEEQADGGDGRDSAAAAATNHDRLTVQFVALVSPVSHWLLETPRPHHRSVSGTNRRRPTCPAECSRA